MKIPKHMQFKAHCALWSETYGTDLEANSEAELYEKITGRSSTVFAPSKGQDK